MERLTLLQAKLELIMFLAENLEKHLAEFERSGTFLFVSRLTDAARLPDQG